jgi:hypothetical protein
VHGNSCTVVVAAAVARVDARGAAPHAVARTAASVAELVVENTPSAVEEEVVVDHGMSCAVLHEVVAPCSLEEWVDHRIGVS